MFGKTAGLNRRRFLGAVGSSVAVAGFAGATERHNAQLRRLNLADFQGQPVDDVLNPLIKWMSESGGGTIELGPGEYEVAKQVLLLDNVLLKGAGNTGADATILKLADGAPPIGGAAGILRMKNDYSSGRGKLVVAAALEDVIIDGNRAAQRQDVADEEKKYGLYAEGTDLRTSRVTIRNCMGYGFDPHANDELDFRTTRMIIEDCHAHDNAKDGFTLDGQVDMVFRRNLAENNDRAGINAVTGTTDVVITDSTVRFNGGDGVVVQQRSGKLSIKDSEIHGNGKHGIYLREAFETQVVDNRIYQNGQAGLRIAGGVQNLVSRNEIFDNARKPGTGHYEVMVGPYKDAISRDNAIMSNQISATSNGVLQEREGAEMTAVVDNVYATNGYGILVFGPGSYADQNLRRSK